MTRDWVYTRVLRETVVFPLFTILELKCLPKQWKWHLTFKKDEQHSVSLSALACWTYIIFVKKVRSGLQLLLCLSAP
jgi:hypothetical protein